MYAHSEIYSDDGVPMPISLGELRDKGIEIPGDGITLRPLRTRDAHQYFELVEYDRNHLSQYGDTTAEKYQTVVDVARSIAKPENPFKLRFGIWDNDTMVGSINIEPLENNRAETGYWVGKRYLRHAYASRALNALSDFAFTGLGYNVLEAEAVYENVASRATLVKCGFEPDGYKGRYYTPDNSDETNHLRLFVVYIKTKPASNDGTGAPTE